MTILMARRCRNNDDGNDSKDVFERENHFKDFSETASESTSGDFAPSTPTRRATILLDSENAKQMLLATITGINMDDDDENEHDKNSSSRPVHVAATRRAAILLRDHNQHLDIISEIGSRSEDDQDSISHSNHLQIVAARSAAPAPAGTSMATSPSAAEAATEEARIAAAIAQLSEYRDEAPTPAARRSTVVLSKEMAAAAAAELQQLNSISEDADDHDCESLDTLEASVVDKAPKNPARRPTCAATQQSKDDIAAAAAAAIAQLSEFHDEAPTPAARRSTVAQSTDMAAAAAAVQLLNTSSKDADDNGCDSPDHFGTNRKLETPSRRSTTSTLSSKSSSKDDTGAASAAAAAIAQLSEYRDEAPTPAARRSTVVQSTDMAAAAAAVQQLNSICENGHDLDDHDCESGEFAADKAPKNPARRPTSAATQQSKSDMAAAVAQLSSDFSLQQQQQQYMRGDAAPKLAARRKTHMQDDLTETIALFQKHKFEQQQQQRMGLSSDSDTSFHFSPMKASKELFLQSMQEMLRRQSFGDNDDFSEDNKKQESLKNEKRSKLGTNNGGQQNSSFAKPTNNSSVPNRKHAFMTSLREFLNTSDLIENDKDFRDLFREVNAIVEGMETTGATEGNTSSTTVASMPPASCAREASADTIEEESLADPATKDFLKLFGSMKDLMHSSKGSSLSNDCSQKSKNGGYLLGSTRDGESEGSDQLFESEVLQQQLQQQQQSSNQGRQQKGLLKTPKYSFCASKKADEDVRETQDYMNIADDDSESTTTEPDDEYLPPMLSKSESEKRTDDSSSRDYYSSSSDEDPSDISEDSDINTCFSSIYQTPIDTFERDSRLSKLRLFQEMTRQLQECEERFRGIKKVADVALSKVPPTGMTQSLPQNMAQLSPFQPSLAEEKLNDFGTTTVNSHTENYTGVNMGDSINKPQEKRQVGQDNSQEHGNQADVSTQRGDSTSQPPAKAVATGSQAKSVSRRRLLVGKPKTLRLRVEEDASAGTTVAKGDRITKSSDMRLHMWKAKSERVIVGAKSDRRMEVQKANSQKRLIDSKTERRIVQSASTDTMESKTERLIRSSDGRVHMRKAKSEKNLLDTEPDKQVEVQKSYSLKRLVNSSEKETKASSSSRRSGRSHMGVSSSKEHGDRRSRSRRESKTSDSAPSNDIGYKSTRNRRRSEGHGHERSPILTPRMKERKYLSQSDHLSALKSPLTPTHEGRGVEQTERSPKGNRRSRSKSKSSNVGAELSSDGHVDEIEESRKSMNTDERKHVTRRPRSSNRRLELSQASALSSSDRSTAKMIIVRRAGSAKDLVSSELQSSRRRSKSSKRSSGESKQPPSTPKASPKSRQRSDNDGSVHSSSVRSSTPGGRIKRSQNVADALVVKAISSSKSSPESKCRSTSLGANFRKLETEKELCKDTGNNCVESGSQNSNRSGRSTMSARRRDDDGSSCASVSQICNDKLPDTEESWHSQRSGRVDAQSSARRSKSSKRSPGRQRQSSNSPKISAKSRPSSRHRRDNDEGGNSTSMQSRTPSGRSKRLENVADVAVVKAMSSSKSPQK